MKQNKRSILPLLVALAIVGLVTAVVLVFIMGKGSIPLCIISAVCLIVVLSVALMKKNGDNQAPVSQPSEREFAENAKCFSGLYELMYKIGSKKMKYRKGVLGDWVTRLNNLANAPSLILAWKERFEGFEEWDDEKAATVISELLEFVKKSGVVRDDSTELTVTETTYTKYDARDDVMITEGEKARVQLPYWHIGEVILEKGVIFESEE